VLHDGTTQTGIVISEDAEKLSLKGSDAIVRTFPLKEIDERTKQKISLMPADLTKQLSIEEMTDIVEYLTVLKKARK
jgi:putative heme-binding domain-containing protein